MKKNLKWILSVCSLILLVAMVGAVLISCGKPETPTDTTTTTTEAPETTAPSQEPEVAWQVAWNINRMEYTGKGVGGETGRKIKSDGYFYLEFAVDGKQCSYKTGDRKMASCLDGLDVALLQVDAEGKILDYRDPYDEGRVAIDRYYVQEDRGSGKFLCNMSLNYSSMNLEYTIPETAAAYNVGATGPACGAPTKPVEGDYIIAICDEKGVITHVFVKPYQKPGDVYWNITRMYDSTSGNTTRKADKSGCYVYEVCVNGEVITVKTKDLEVANAMDQQAARCWGLTFDEEGYVTGVRTAREMTGGGAVASWFTVMEVRADGSFVAEKLSVGASDFGQVEDLKPGKNCKIINTTTVGKQGEYTKLQVGDQIHCLKDSRDQVCYIFIHGRIAGGNMYWNVERKYDSNAKTTTRTPDADGYYRILLATNGEQVTLKCKDKEIVNQMDANGARCFALAVTEDGEITEYRSTKFVTGGGVPASWYDVTSINEDGTITVERTLSGDEYGKVVTLKLAADAQVINGSENYSSHCGEFATVKVGDRIHALADFKGEVKFLYIVMRPVSVPIYWNVERMYDSTTKETFRERAEDGYFYFNMTSEGKEVTVKTKSWETANKMDSFAARCMGLKVNSSGVVTKVYNTSEVKNYEGSVEVSWCFVTEVDGNKVTALRTYSGADQGKKYTFNVGSWTDIYNESNLFVNNRGEETTLKEGDLIHCLRNKNKATTMVFVIERSVDGPIYWNIDRQWDDTNKVTKRTPDAEGWYWFDMAGGGERHTFKTQDPAIANKIDSQAARCWGLKVTEDGVIEEVYGASSVRGATGGVQVSWCHITEIHEDYAIAEKKGSGPDHGAVYRIDFADDMKAYNVSKFVNSHVGEETTLKVGDEVHCFRNLEMETTTVMVITPGVETTIGYCPVCKTDVQWAPWDTVNHRVAADVHYYLESDVTIPAMISISGGETTIALNGHKLTTQGQAFRVFGNTTLTIFDAKEDASEIGGSMVTMGGDAKTEGGLIGLWNTTATLNVYSGTLRHASKDEGGVDVLHGGIVAGNGTVNMYGGKMSGGHATGDGGNIRIWNNGANEGANVGHVNLYGGVIENGSAGNYGGNIALSNFGTITIPADSTAVVSGGTAAHGGNIAVRTSSKLTMAGGTVTDGKALNKADIGNGGNIAVEKSAEAVITGGTIEKGEARRGGQISVFGVADISGITLAGGKATFHGSGIFVYINNDSEAELTLKDITVTGGTGNDGVRHSGKKLTLSGDVIITDNGAYNLRLNDGRTLTVGEGGMGAKAKVGISLTGSNKTFGKAVANTDKGAFFPDNDLLQVVCDSDLNLQLQVPGVDMTHEPASHCVCGGNAGGVGGHTCDTNITWTAWGDDAGEISAVPTTAGNYYLVNDINLTAGAVLSNSDVVLCLNGHTITTTDRIYRLNGASSISVCDHKVNGEYKGEMVTMGFDPDTFAADTSGALTEGGLFLGWSSESSVNIYGGILRMASEEDGGKMAKNGGLIASGGIVRIYDGVIENGTAGNYGGNIGLYNHAGHGYLYVYGGTISGGSAKYGANIASRRNITTHLLGGTITGGIASEYAAGVYMAGSNFKELKIGGDVVITGNTAKGAASNLYLAGINLLTVDALGENANVGITMTATGLVGSNVTVDPGTKITSDDGEKNLVYDPDADTLSLIVPRTPHTHCVCTGAYTGHTCAADTEWTPLSEALASVGLTMTTADFGKLPSGNYYLDDNVTVTATTAIGNKEGTVIKNIAICLNDFDITTNATRVFGNVRNGSTLTITDCSYDRENGTFGGTVYGGTSIYGPIIYTNAGSVLNIYGGNFTRKNSTTESLAGLFVVAMDESPTNNADPAYRAVMNLYNGKIYGGVAGEGGNVDLFHVSRLNMFGGTIADGVSKPVTSGSTTWKSGGGNIMISSGSSAVISGGVISGGSAQNQGGNILAKGTLTITGGTITGGKCDQGGGVYGSKSVTVSGNVNITGNTTSDGTKASNLYLAGVNLLELGELGENASVGVAMAADGILATNVTADPGVGTKLTADNAAQPLTYQAEKTRLILGEAPPEHAGHCVCGSSDTLEGHTHNAAAEWLAWDGTTAFENGKAYFLTKNIDLSTLALHADLNDVDGDGKAEWLEISGKNVTLCLNGHTITSASRVFKLKSGAVLNITDHKNHDGTYSGAVIGKGLTSAHSSAKKGDNNGENNEGGVIAVWTGGCQLNIFGGNIRMADKADLVAIPKKGGLIQNYGTVRLYDGVLENGVAINAGASVNMWAYGAKFAMYGGTLRNAELTGSNKFGSHIYGSASATAAANTFPTAELLGGEITGGKATGSGAVYLERGSLIIGGDVVIANNTKADGTTLSNVYIGNNTTFTLKESANANVGIDAATKNAKIGTVSKYEDRNGIFCDNAAYSPYVTGTELHLKEGHWHCACGGQNKAPGHTHEDIQFAAWDKTNEMPASGNYYLKNGVTNPGTTNTSGALHLCLNGQTVTTTNRLYWIYHNTDLADCGNGGKIIRNSATGNGSMAYIHYNTEKSTAPITVNVYGGLLDSVNTTASASEGGVFAVDASNTQNAATLNIHAGELNGAAMKNGGTVIMWNKAAMNMYGGKIAGGSATGSGGNVQIGNGVFHMYGGAVSGGTANEGGNICIYPSGELIVDNALVENGEATSCGGNIMVFNKLTVNEDAIIRNGIAGGSGGGNIGCFGNNTDIVINGGTITGGKATKGANITLRTNDSKTIKFTMLGGTVEGVHPDCKDNTQSVRINNPKGIFTLGGNAKIDQLYLCAGATLVESTQAPLTEKASIGITAENDGAFMTVSGVIDYLKVFAATNSAKAVTKEDMSLKIG